MKHRAVGPGDQYHSPVLQFGDRRFIDRVLLANDPRNDRPGQAVVGRTANGPTEELATTDLVIGGPENAAVGEQHRATTVAPFVEIAGTLQAPGLRPGLAVVVGVNDELLGVQPVDVLFESLGSMGVAVPGRLDTNQADDPAAGQGHHRMSPVVETVIENRKRFRPGPAAVGRPAGHRATSGGSLEVQGPPLGSPVRSQFRLDLSGHGERRVPVTRRMGHQQVTIGQTINPSGPPDEITDPRIVVGPIVPGPGHQQPGLANRERLGSHRGRGANGRDRHNQGQDKTSISNPELVHWSKFSLAN